MGPDYYLKSIARTAVFPHGKNARKKDCHSATACYVVSDDADGSDIIALLGSEESDMVFHSIVLNSAHDIVSDSFPGYKRIKYDKKNIIVTYDGNLDEPVVMHPVKTITIADFKDKYMKNITETTTLSFKGFLIEAHHDSLDSVRDRWTADGIKHFIYEKNGTITVSQIVVPKDERSEGKGSAAMKVLINYADKTNQRIVLSPSTSFGGSRGRLTEFYKRFGFVDNKGKNKDFTTQELMIRVPTGDKNES